MLKNSIVINEEDICNYLNIKFKLQAGGADQSSGHNQPPAKRVRVMPPSTVSNSMVSSDYQVNHITTSPCCCIVY